MARRFLQGGRRRISRVGQTLVEYSLLLSLISLVAMSALEELGVHVKSSIATANCAMIWAQHNVSGGGAEVNAAWAEISTMLDKTFDSNKSAEVKMKNKVIATQTAIKNKFLGQ